MYINNYFKQPDKSVIEHFIKHNGFGIIVSRHSDRIIASHIPMLYSARENGEGVLQGHLARGNEQWRSFQDNEEVLVIFTGPHAYVSSSWYTHENVPTWNYIAVHMYGSIRVLDGPELLDSLRTLVDKYEATSKVPVSVEGLSAGYMEKAMKGIVGFEIDVKEIQATFKLSQNREAHDFQNIIDALREQDDAGAQAIADAMEGLQEFSDKERWS